MGLAALLVGTGVVAVLAQLRVDQAAQRLTEQWMPALVSLERLQRSFLDQQTGVRGYVLTGQPPLLAPFRVAEEAMPGQEGALRQALGGDPTASAQLVAVREAHADWIAAAREQIARVDQGRRAEAQQVATAATSTPRFDALRGRVDELRETIQARVDTASADVTRLRTAVLTLLTAAVLVGLALSVVLLVGLRRAVTRPLGQLVDAVTGVAEGQLDRPVPVTGPQEIATVAEAAERMRQALHRHAEDTATAAEREARLQESERIAAQLQETVASRLFTAGLAVLSVANRSPAVAEPLRRVVDELDAAGRELRALALGLAPQVEPLPTDLHERVSRAAQLARDELGLDVRLHWRGPADASASPELVDQVSMIFRNIGVELARIGVRTVEVELVALEDADNSVRAVRLCVTFAPPPGSVAARFPREMSVRSSELPDGHTVLEWSSAGSGRDPAQSP
jgi:CHASE3 domain sensor protein